MAERKLPCGMTINRPNYVWCADITYVPVIGRFMYLVAVMDWFSRSQFAAIGC